MCPILNDFEVNISAGCMIHFLLLSVWPFLQAQIIKLETERY